MKKFLSLIIIILNECDYKSHAQSLSPIQTDRPDQTETPFTVPDNHFQMETGFSFEQTNNSTQSITTPSVLYKFGLNDHFEIGLITELTTIKTSQQIFGLNPVTVRFKEKIADEKGAIPTTSFIGYLTIPDLASTEFKSKWFAPSFRFTMQHTLTENITLGYNLGAEWDGESPEPIFIYTLTTGFSLSNKTGAYVEVYGFVPQTSKVDHRVDGGFTYSLRPNMLIDISGGAGITEDAPEYYVALGFSFRLKD